MLHGSCYCKTVKYESNGRVLHFLNCHCPDCRKLSGATFVPFLIVKADGFRVVAGEENLSPFESSPGKIRHFCKKCGTHLFRKGDGVVILRAGTLDDDPGIRPEADIWTNYKASWHDIRADAVKFEEGFTRRK
jgi:ADP-ribosyl-[dinitrogen reductase] hydrolase